MLVQESKLKKFILDSGLTSRAEILAAEKEAEKNGGSIGDLLVKQGKISTDDLRRVQAYILGIPFVDLKGQKVDFGVLSLIPEPIARKHNIIAFRKTDSGLEVAMLDVDDLEAIDFVRKKVGLKIMTRLTDQESVKGALLQYQKSLKAEFGDLIQQEAQSIKMLAEDDDNPASEKDLKKLAEDLPVVRIVDTLLNHAIIQSASDISNLKLDEKRLPQDGRFKIQLNNEKVSFRVSTLPTHHGEKTVMRLLRETSGGFTLEALGFHGQGLEALHAAMNQHVGMLLVTGPTGSGKTTTLYTLLDILNTPDVNISTIEDPVEYQMPRINQTQVKPEIGLTFAAGLRALLRQDPDIIMVGEIRDGETASLGINAALTGHLVLSTLHTNSAAGTLPRFIDMGAEPFLIVSTVNVIIAQRLVRKLCGVKDKYTLSKAEVDALGKKANLDLVMASLKDEGIVNKDATWETVPFYKAKATPECDEGYKGRLSIHEVLRMTSGIRELSVANSSAEQIEERARKEGMLTMLEDGIFKAAQGLTTIEEVYRVVSE
ncbi:MAG: Type II secretion system protein E [Parcubacteria group bacterium GW2011_GWA2_47_7]|nr:MAG: Type II secretion system protein E [Parcubacteria group bacterium GW2011_GWA2_47_7]